MNSKSESAWPEFMSESGLSMNDNIEEGILIDLEDDTTSPKPIIWREFASDPGINLSDDNVSVPQRHSLPTTRPTDLITKHDRDSKTSLDMLAEKYGVMSKGQINIEGSLQWITPKLLSENPHNSQVTMATTSNSGLSTNQNLPTRPLTIGENETAMVYRPLSPFNPDLYPSRNSIPVTAVVTQTQRIPDLDDVRDMSAQERLQPLGRDGLEVKQGPPWGVSMPLFQPHSRDSSISSDDGSSYTRMQIMPQTPKYDNESGQISRRSSIKSLESKEPVASVKIPTPDKDSIRQRKSLEVQSINVHSSTVSSLLVSNDVTTDRTPYSTSEQVVSSGVNFVPYTSPSPIMSTEVPYTKPAQMVSTDINEIPYFTPKQMVSTEVPYPKPAQMVPTDIGKVPYSKPQIVSTEVPYPIPAQMVPNDIGKVPYSKPQIVSTEVPYPKPAQMVSEDINVPYSTPPVTIDDNITTMSWVTPQTMETSLIDSGAEMWTLSSGRHSAPILDGVDGSNGIGNTENKITIPTLIGSKSDHDMSETEILSKDHRFSRDGNSIFENGSVPKSSNIIPALRTRATNKPSEGKFDKFLYKTPLGRFHHAQQDKTDTDSPVSRILGPTFKTTQRILQELQKRPLVTQPTNFVPQIAEKENAYTNVLSDSNGTDVYNESKGVLEDNKIQVQPNASISTNVSNSSDVVANDSSSERNANAVNPLLDKQLDLHNRESSFGESAKYNQNGANIEKQNVGSEENFLQNKERISLGVETASAKNVDSEKERQSMSWDNMLGVDNNGSSEFERVASQSISISNAVATSFREELNKTDTRLDSDSGEEEGVLTDVTTTPDHAMDSGVTESSTNEEIYFQPKGLVPLGKKQGPAGIYDVRKSTSPGSTNRKRVAVGQSVLKPVVGAGKLYTPVYVTEEQSSTEIDEKSAVDIPDGRSTPKLREPTKDLHKTSNLVNGVRRPMSPSNVDSTWSVKSPVMSQFDSKTNPLFSQHNWNGEARKENTTQRHERKHGPRVQNRVPDTSESSQWETPKNNVADIILENFRRDEKEQKRRQQKMLALKQMDSTADLNALWLRFQDVFGKKRTHRHKRHHFTPKHTQTPPRSELSSSRDADVSGNSSNNTQVGSISDSNIEFDRYLQRVRQIESSYSESTDYRRKSTPSTEDSRSKISTVETSELERPLVKTLNNKRPKPLKQPSVNENEPCSKTTSVESSAFETPLVKPRPKHLKQAFEKHNKPSVCTCGVRKVKARVPNVREIGINCPTPPISPVNNVPTMKDTSSEAATKMAPVEDMVQLTQAPDSLVKLSLQDAFVYSNQDFIRRSRQRVVDIKVKRHEKAKDIIVIPTENTKPKTLGPEELQTEVDKPLRVYAQLALKKPRPMSQKQIRNVNKRMCKKLPEVKKRKEEERRAAYYQTNRLRAQLYGKHVRNLNRMYTVH